MQDITRSVVRGLLPRRDADTNKGSFGSVLAVAGSMAYRGAAALCVEGALRGGAGLVLAALAAQGISRIEGIEWIERGYEHFCENLTALGAEIWKK